MSHVNAKTYEQRMLDLFSSFSEQLKDQKTMLQDIYEKVEKKEISQDCSNCVKLIKSIEEISATMRECELKYNSMKIMLEQKDLDYSYLKSQYKQLENKYESYKEDVEMKELELENNKKSENNTLTENNTDITDNTDNTDRSITVIHKKEIEKQKFKTEPPVRKNSNKKKPNLDRWK